MNLGTGEKKETSSLIQIYLLLALWFLGIILGASAINLLLGEASYDTANNIRISNSVGSIFMFLIPATVYTWLFMGRNGEFLVRSPISLKPLLFGVLAILCIQPFTEVVNYYNELIVLPDYLSGMQEFFDNAKESSEKTFSILFADKTISSLLLNLLVLATLPAVVEELFFRGCLQRSIHRAAKNIHIAIWITAILFSLMHFQLAGLFPRILLGALLGYLYYWTKNIWIPIIAHAANNSAVIIIAQLLKDTDWYKHMEVQDYSISGAGVPAVISLVVSIALLYLVYKYSCNKQEEKTDQ